MDERLMLCVHGRIKTSGRKLYLGNQWAYQVYLNMFTCLDVFENDLFRQKILFCAEPSSERSSNRIMSERGFSTVKCTKLTVCPQKFPKIFEHVA